jgi:hypothetical protein
MLRRGPVAHHWPTGSGPLAELYHEMLVEIVSHMCTLRDRRAARLVSRAWNKAYLELRHNTGPVRFCALSVEQTIVVLEYHGYPNENAAETVGIYLGDGVHGPQWMTQRAVEWRNDKAYVNISYNTAIGYPEEWYCRWLCDSVAQSPWIWVNPVVLAGNVIPHNSFTIRIHNTAHTWMSVRHEVDKEHITWRDSDGYTRSMTTPCSLTSRGAVATYLVRVMDTVAGEAMPQQWDTWRATMHEWYGMDAIIATLRWPAFVKHAQDLNDEQGGARIDV